MDSGNQRRYADTGTQTSPVISPNLAASSFADQSILTAAGPRVANPAHSDCAAFKGSTENEEHVSTHKNTFSSELPSFEHSLPLLPAFPSSFSLQRYTTSSQFHTSTNRSVSLPEALYDEDLRLVLSQLTDYSSLEVREQPRVVSMPESLQLHAQRYASAHTYGYREPIPSSLERIKYDGRDIADSEGLRSSSSTPSTPGTIVMHSLSSDQYHTPSPPPSSCDSVEFTLEDPAHVPDSFLRRSCSPPLIVPAVTGKAAGLLEDDGWLTWANSPPRPIPALHGPSSLPYARCPSGAEGTIIGEPSSLPRMIWGLDPNDAVPASHVPQPQPSRAVSIKHPAGNFKSRYGTQQGLASTASTPATFGFPHIGPRFGNQDMNYNSFEQTHGGREHTRSTPMTLDARREEDPRNFRRMTRDGLGVVLNATGHEEPIRLEYRYEHDRIMDYSHLHAGEMGPSDAVDRGFELLPVEKEIQRQRPSDIRNQEEIYRKHPYSSGTRKRHSSNLIELLSSPVNLLDRAPHAYSCVAPDVPPLSTQGFTPSFLPTPPNSSSPQWSSVFSPLRNNHSSIANFSHGRCDPSSDAVMRQQKNTTNEELSDELRRFVFENMSPISSANAIDALKVFPISQTSATNVFLTTPNGESPSDSPAHPPGLPIPRHILLSKALEPFDPLSAQRSTSPKSSPPSPSPYTRSTFSNPRSIPLSRLRQKRGAIKLATVPEEESAEPNVHDGRMAPESTPLRVFLRTPSPLDGKLHAQSMEEKTVFGEDIKLGRARVRLPHSKGSAQYANLGPGQNTTPEGSPKKKRLQRRKRPVRPAESGKLGSPLVTEGTVWFGPSTSSVTHDVRKEEDQLTLAYARSGRIKPMGNGVLDRYDTPPRRSDKRVTT